MATHPTADEARAEPLQLIEELERLRYAHHEITQLRSCAVPNGGMVQDGKVAGRCDKALAHLGPLIDLLPTLATTIRELVQERDRLRNVLLCARDVKCPRDTNGDNDCGQPGCPVCGPGGIKPYAKSALLAGKEQQ